MNDYLLDGQETERLSFRKIKPSDFEVWLTFHQDKRTSEFWSGLPPNEKIACEQDFERTFYRYENNLGGKQAVVLKGTNELIGLCGLLVQEIDGAQELEIAYSLLPKHWGNGYATEAATKCKEFAFENDLAESLISVIQIDNLPSQKVALNNGMFLDKTTTYSNNQVHIFRVHGFGLRHHKTSSKFVRQASFMNKNHWAIFIDNTSKKGHLIDMLLQGNPPENFQGFQDAKGVLFSKLAVERYIDEEDRHDTKILTADTEQPLKSMSSGEQKKALLKYILSADCDFIVFDNPFDNLDTDTQAELKIRLEAVSKKIAMVQLVSRKGDLLPFIKNFARLDGDQMVFIEKGKEHSTSRAIQQFDGEIPPPLHSMDVDGDILIALKKVNVSYGDKPILKAIDWTIAKGDFWELRGKNGSGKTTILSMITGENPKGYGQELYIFGRKKGSGESVWDIKKKIGYFTPSMTDKFTGYHSVEHMIISGLNDSIGLYTKPTEVQLRLAKEWLQLIDLWQIKDMLYHDLSMGQKRLVMCARAMIKHPALLILDEPTAGLDDTSAALFVALVNKFAKESETTIIFVSHRKETGLEPDHIYQLKMTESGSLGKRL